MKDAEAVNGFFAMKFSKQGAMKAYGKESNT